ncbi:sigma-70 family RNA polymerase sigma factor [Megasphaera paucivorans]|uniref:Phage transcriptional activator, RinA family n=1 Tax=Megasphaera paucivorans TaxID=349095 RepID=A0A1G9RI22_9FIRM|nr:sigma-70 family RNA polymerase sigma factor [Megasphaera paucivorans]SDM22972.1 hypothetical protein SAMN05660299_00473 [Megasphaera paucivorans]
MDRSKNVAVIKYYLQHYQEQMTYIENVKADIADYEAMLSLNAAPKIPSLSFAPGGNGSDLSQQEQEYFKKEKIPNKIAALRTELAEKEPIMNRLNRSLEALTESDRMIICNKYIKEMSWKMTAACVNCSEGYCRKRSEKVLEILAEMVFGTEDIPVQTDFLF